jgi:hypothetical protein
MAVTAARAFAAQCVPSGVTMGLRLHPSHNNVSTGCARSLRSAHQELDELKRLLAGGGETVYSSGNSRSESGQPASLEETGFLDIRV